MRRRIAFIAAVALFLAAVGGVGAVARSRGNLLNAFTTFAVPAQESTIAQAPYVEESTSAWEPGPYDTTQEPPAVVWHTTPYLPDSRSTWETTFPMHLTGGFPGFAGVWSRVDADGQMIDARLSCWDMRTQYALYAPDTRAVRLTITNLNDQNLLWYGEEVFVLQYWDGEVWETCQPKDPNLVQQSHEQALAKGETKATFPLGEYALPGEGYYRIHTSIDVVSPKGYPYQLFSIFEISSGGAFTLSEASAAQLIREPW